MKLNLYWGSLTYPQTSKQASVICNNWKSTLMFSRPLSFSSVCAELLQPPELCNCHLDMMTNLTQLFQSSSTLKLCIIYDPCVISQ